MKIYPMDYEVDCTRGEEIQDKLHSEEGRIKRGFCGKDGAGSTIPLVMVGPSTSRKWPIKPIQLRYQETHLQQLSIVWEYDLDDRPNVKLPTSMVPTEVNWMQHIEYDPRLS